VGRVILETARLLLREFDERDAAAFYALGSDPAIIRYTGDPGGGLRSVEHAAEVLRSHPLADYREHGFGRWACVLRGSDAVIGFAGLKRLPELGEVDIGYRFLPPYWGAGLATEAGRAVLAYGFGPLGLRRVIGLAEPENAASVRVLEKLGLRADGSVEYGGKRVARYVVEAAPGAISAPAGGGAR
jgi:ribosomal-protein-alanine N-acetyltransferase